MLNRKYYKRNTIKKELNGKIDEEVQTQLTKQRLRTARHIGKLKSILKQKLESNESIRSLNPESLKDKNIISIFDSTLTRTLDIQANTLTKDIIVVQAYFFDVLRDLVTNGFMLETEKYVLFTASAGQIRTKKTVFIKEQLFKKHSDTLMCGLTIEKINTLGGMNINKFLAYLALSNSATDKWIDFDIRRSIVVEDLETDVPALVDYIDRDTYEIERKEMPVAINHTDGCGMILPSKSKKSFMTRLPWIKGLLVPFPFAKFAKDSGNTIVTDIYGKQYDIVKDKIEVIFTKSQFKMWKYYSSWQEYCDCFEEYNCQAAKCNEEEDFFSNAKLNYQMLQTLNEMTDEELSLISQDTVNVIADIGRDKKTMLKVLGATKSNLNKSYFQQAVELYPDLLTDPFSKDVLKNVKKSMINDAKAGKLLIEGKYTFIIPDLYAFCERLFLGTENPVGLLKDGEVYCSLFENEKELDCLRSPHLYREHAVRINKLDTEKKKYFVTKGLYASVHDVISRILQFDVDGDKSLVVSDPTIVEAAKRHMDGIVPLYYEMAVVGKEIINPENLYSGLVTAYTSGNIGEISNNISKIWNSQDVDLDAVKWMCMENNFVIDAAKTLFTLTRPAEKDEQIKQFTKCKLPTFFLYAKDKEDKQVEPTNTSTVNRLASFIPNNRLVFKDSGLKKLDYTNLLRDKEYIEDSVIIHMYEEFNLKRRFIKITKDNLHIYRQFRESLLEVNEDPYYITDVLVHHLFVKKKASKKELLWQSFGDILVENIKANLNKTRACECCGTEIEAKQAKKYCDSCAATIRKEYLAKKKREYRQKSKGTK